MNEEALHTLSSGYLLPGETPRDMMTRLSSTASKINDDPTLNEDLFHCLWSGWIGASSPVASNFGTNRGQSIACFSTHLTDSVSSIYSHLKEVAQLSKSGGGVGNYFGDVRPAGSPITGGGKSIGVVPWMQQYDSCARVVSQGGVRRGSFAFYLPIDHPDVPELLRAKDHTKGDPRNWIDSNIALTISDEWIESMIAGDTHKHELFAEVLKTRMISGSPYLIFIDNANNQNPECYTERGLSVKTSNLCFTADTLVAVADGRNSVPIRDLVNTSFPVYSAYWRTHQTAASKNQWVTEIKKAVAFKTGTQEVIEVGLEDGSTFKCTPDHLLARRDGLWVEAQHSVGEILEPFSSFVNEFGHRMINTTTNGHNSQSRVTSIQSIGVEDVYDLRVEDNHNFFIVTKTGDINSGVLVHNCSEIFLHTDENHTFVCVLSSLNLSRYDEYKNWKSPISGRTVPQIGIHLLEAVVSEFIRKAKDKVGMGRAVRFAEKSRALGLGVMGLHSLYQLHGLPAKSHGARALNIETSRWIKEEAVKASKELAERFGEPEWCKGTGMRHTHLIAIAPTKTNSVICGAGTEGIEPRDRNYYVAKQGKGTYVRKNQYLEKIFSERGIGPEVWDQILEAKGSVQGLDCLTDHEKEVFKTAREVDQFELIKQASDRQPFVCQGQSLNLFPDPESDAAYITRLHLAAWKMKLKSLYYLKGSSLLTNKEVVPALIVTREGCPWCVKLKEELSAEGVRYEEITKAEAEEKGFWDPEWKTVPQLWLYKKHIGGYTEYIQYKEESSVLKFNLPTETTPEYTDCTACEA
jgi:ribonucleotide reductase alpha subunit/glutaredoxin